MSLICINGKEGSGKDLVGRIIQMLQFGFEDKFVIDALENPNNPSNIGVHYEWKVKKFAGKVNEVYEIVTGIDFHSLSREDKEKERDRFIDFAEGVKKSLGDKVWVNALFRNYVPTHIKSLCSSTLRRQGDLYKFKQYVDKSIGMDQTGYIDIHGDHQCIHNNSTVEFIYHDWIITDLRFYEEYQKIQEHKGLCVSIQTNTFTDEDVISSLELMGYADIEDSWEEIAINEGYSYHGNLWLFDETSASLQGRSVDWDWIIKNDSDIPGLIEEVKVMIKNL